MCLGKRKANADLTGDENINDDVSIRMVSLHYLAYVRKSDAMQDRKG